MESPADKVRRLGTIVGLANHTILIRKDGMETAIDDSGAPISGRRWQANRALFWSSAISTERKLAERADTARKNQSV